jgi:uncharacterized membrane protein
MMSKSSDYGDARARKRARFAQSRQRRSPIPFVIAAGAGILVVAAVFLWSQGGSVAQQVEAPEGEQVVQIEGSSLGASYPMQDGAVRMPLSTFDDGAARFYAYRSEATTIEFFVLKSSDGVVRAAFNACDVCYAAGLGYHQEGDEMVCDNCGQRFPSGLINEVRGGCNPAPLERTVEGDELLIMADDILSGEWYFQ